MFDVLVIGGGHAGTEAAAAAARMGARTALVTFSPATIGAMSCNPAIGGLGKGHIVREIDAFDGIMGRAADAAAIHYRMLNASKGTAVQGPRVQADRRRYAVAVQQRLAMLPALINVVGEIDALLIDGDRVAGVALADGQRIGAQSVVIATGTFLGARLFRGEDRSSGGRWGERPATPLAAQLRGLGLPVARLKTGTPPRLDGRTIDWAALDEQPSDDGTWTMSSMTGRRLLPAVSCAITRTSERAHDLIRQTLDRSPLFSGAIDAPGPRYCPSIEDKVHRFGDRDGHQVFLEPEGLADPLVYPNGLSTSLPVDAQEKLVASIKGLERARIVTPGYAVEYDYLDPRSLDATLSLSILTGVFCAGQINGTTGYEEAAGQGLVAGVNAAAHALGRAPLRLDRASSYIGVMIDDLTLQGVTEPYRMLTARAEFRLSLRADNAETRLGAVARSTGCVSPERAAHQRAREQQRQSIRRALDVSMTAGEVAGRGVVVAQDGQRRSVFEWLRHASAPLDRLVERDPQWPEDIVSELVEDARYAPYLERQAAEIAQMRRSEALPLPIGFDFAGVPGLSNEMVARLMAARPKSLAAVGRVRGITPAAVSAIYLHANRRAA